MRILYAAVLLAAVVATPAMAQDGPVDAPFTGVKVVGTIAYDNLSADGENQSGFGYGGSVGYDVQAGNLVIGGEGEILFSTAKDCVAGLCLEAGRDLYAGGRIGTAVSENALLYVKLGYTNARVKLTSNNTTIDRENLDGIRAGVGVEAAVGRNAFVRAEYRYSNYEQDLSRNQGVVSVGFRF